MYKSQYHRKNHDGIPKGIIIDKVYKNGIDQYCLVLNQAEINEIRVNSLINDTIEITLFKSREDRWGFRFIINDSQTEAEVISFITSKITDYYELHNKYAREFYELSKKINR